MQWNEHLGTGLLLHHGDDAIADVWALHPHDIADTLRCIEKKIERKPFTRTKRPALFVSGELFIRPGVMRPDLVLGRSNERVVPSLPNGHGKGKEPSQNRSGEIRHGWRIVIFEAAGMNSDMMSY